MRSGLRGTPGLHMVRVENPVGPGTPDVNWCGRNRATGEVSTGWVELKYLEAWPKRASTLVRIKHYTQQQRDWLLLRHAAGGRVALLLQVRREYLLFKGAACQEVGGLRRYDLLSLASDHWLQPVGWAEVLEEMAR